MKKVFAFLILSTLLQSCNDGDIIVTSFNFSAADLQSCGDVGNYVFFQINPAANESLSLKLSTQDSIYSLEETKEYQLDGTNNFVNYRTYDSSIGSNYFCSSIPPTSPNVTVNYLAASGTAALTKIFVYDDNDNVPSDKEFSGDTDGDGLPDRYDLDDDGDNVPTSRELDTENLDGDNDPFTNALDTDGDKIPDYLDNDDDNDGVLTIQEDKNGNLDPTDDKTDPSVGADYLNPAVAIPANPPIAQYRLHKYTIQKSIGVILSDLVLVNGNEEIIEESINMGTIENAVTVPKEITPAFVPPSN